MRVKKPSKKSLWKKARDECDDLISEIVRLRDKRCMICPIGQQRSPLLQCGHYISRKFYSVRFDLDNCNAQCQYCNSYHRFNTFPYDDWIIKNKGLDKWRWLHQQARVTKQYKLWELEELKEELGQILLRLFWGLDN